MQNKTIIINVIICFEKLALCIYNMKRRNLFKSTVNTGVNWLGQRGERSLSGPVE